MAFGGVHMLSRMTIIMRDTYQIHKQNERKKYANHCSFSLIRCVGKIYRIDWSSREQHMLRRHAFWTTVERIVYNVVWHACEINSRSNMTTAMASSGMEKSNHQREPVKIVRVRWAICGATNKAKFEMKLTSIFLGDIFSIWENPKPYGVDVEGEHWKGRRVEIATFSAQFVRWFFFLLALCRRADEVARDTLSNRNETR